MALASPRDPAGWRYALELGPLFWNRAKQGEGDVYLLSSMSLMAAVADYCDDDRIRSSYPSMTSTQTMAPASSSMLKSVNPVPNVSPFSCKAGRRA